MENKNIFDNVKFGDKFVTRDNRIAVFVGIYIDEDNEQWWKFVISDENEIRFYNEYCKSGLLDMSDGDFPNDIIAKYQEPIDETKLDKLASINTLEIVEKGWNDIDGFTKSTLYQCCYDAYKLGYKKANYYENYNII